MSTVVNSEQLPDELLWAEGGHASDVVLTSLADGQRAIVPAHVVAHVERCPACMAHLGHSALLSLETRRMMVPVRRPIPRLAIGMGLVTAAVGLLPWLVTGPDPARGISSLARQIAMFRAHLDINGNSPFAIIATYATAVLLVFAGLALARFSKKEVSSS